jgi:hypothetical protein
VSCLTLYYRVHLLQLELSLQNNEDEPASGSMKLQIGNCTFSLSLPLST